MPLTEDRRVQLDSIVQQMTTNKESDADIQLVVNDFKSKYEGQQGPDLAQQQQEMANIPAQTPEQEAGVVAAQTPGEIEANRQEAMRFLWPGAKTAKEHFIKGTTPALEIAGAVAGAPAGPYGSALGFGAGGAAGRGIEVITGLREPETAVGAMVRTGRDVGIGMLPMGIGKVAKIPGIVKGGITRGSQVTKVVKKIGGKMVPSVAGESGLKGVQDTFRNVSKTGDELYETAKSLAPKDAKLSLEKTYDTIDRILQDQSLNESEKQVARDALAKISPEVRTGTRGRFSLTEGETKHIKEAAPEKWIGEAGTITKPISFEEAYTLRRDLSKITKGGGTKAHVSGDILDTLHEELADNASKLNVPEVTGAFQDAINYWRDVVSPQRKIMGTLEKKSVEKIPSLLSTNLKMIEDLKKAMPEENFTDLKRGMVTDILTRAENSPTKVHKIVRKLLSGNKEVMEHVFNADEMGALNLVGDPGKLKVYLEDHPSAKWILSILTGGAISAIVYRGLRREGK